jgi:hypothetical protein
MTQRYLGDFAVGQILTPLPARGVWHPDNPRGNPDMVKRTEAEFQGDDFVTLRGWLYTLELGMPVPYMPRRVSTSDKPHILAGYARAP